MNYFHSLCTAIYNDCLDIPPKDCGRDFFPMSSAVVLFSGGLDSTTVLALCRATLKKTYALTIDYGQLHQSELNAATKLADHFAVTDHNVLKIDLSSIAFSALTTKNINVPKDRTHTEITNENTAPATYVPARNSIFLSLALAWAESLDTSSIYLGVNEVDASGYPDCRPDFIESFQHTADLATHRGRSNRPIKIVAPLLNKSKSQIIQLGLSLNVDYSMTHTCYEPILDLACGSCDACVLRKKGFEDAGVLDQTRYANNHG